MGGAKGRSGRGLVGGGERVCCWADWIPVPGYGSSLLALVALVGVALDPAVSLREHPELEQGNSGAL